MPGAEIALVVKQAPAGDAGTETHRARVDDVIAD